MSGSWLQWWVSCGAVVRWTSEVERAVGSGVRATDSDTTSTDGMRTTTTVMDGR